MRTLQIQHDHTNLLAAFQPAFHEAGEVDVWRTFEDPAPESLAPYDAVVLMGGVAMPDEDDRYPWIPEEVRLLREGLERELPMLGVCFGGQILAPPAARARSWPPRHTPRIGTPVSSASSSRSSSAASHGSA